VCPGWVRRSLLAEPAATVLFDVIDDVVVTHLPARRSLWRRGPNAIVDRAVNLFLHASPQAPARRRCTVTQFFEVCRSAVCVEQLVHCCSGGSPTVTNTIVVTALLGVLRPVRVLCTKYVWDKWMLYKLHSRPEIMYIMYICGISDGLCGKMLSLTEKEMHTKVFFASPHKAHNN